MANLITRNIPNTLTCCNLISGCIATVFALCGDTKLALLWIVMGAVFDFFDGMSARLFSVSSPIGKELDSLADDVTFGVAPAAIVFNQLSILEYPSVLAPVSAYVPYFAFVMAAFSALRLAKFNLDTRQTTSFIGLPTPANALFWGSLIVFNPEWLTVHSWSIFIILALILITSYLLVCELPLFALKFKQWSFKGNEVKYGFIAFTVVVLALAIVSEGAIGFLQAWWLIILVYVLTSLFLFLKKKK